jgi:transcription initiation factor IIE alpha subunit
MEGMQYNNNQLISNITRFIRMPTTHLIRIPSLILMQMQRKELKFKPTIVTKEARRILINLRIAAVVIVVMKKNVKRGITRVLKFTEAQKLE